METERLSPKTVLGTGSHAGFSAGTRAVFGIVMVIAILMPCSASAAEADLTQRFQTVANLSEGERDHLKRNFETFESLPSDRQTHFRGLYDEIQTDTSKGGELHSVMQTYALWLKTLTPGQRDDLRRETDPNKRLQLVRKFKEEQERRSEQQASFVAGWGNRWRGNRGPALSAADVQAVLQKTYDSLPLTLQREVTTTDGLLRSREILENAFRQAGGRPNWPSEAQLPSLIEGISEARLKADLEAQQTYDQRRGSFTGMLYRGLGQLIGQEIERRLPKEEELQKFFSSLDSTRRDELMQLSPGDSHRRLVFLYIQDKAPEIRQLFEVRNEFGGRFGGGPGNGGGPGGGSPGSDGDDRSRRNGRGGGGRGGPPGGNGFGPPGFGSSDSGPGNGSPGKSTPLPPPLPQNNFPPPEF